MSELHDAAMRAGVFQVIEREAKAQKDAAKAELAALPVGDAVAGRVDGEVLCKASWSKGREKVIVTDERALLEWVKQHHPTEVVESVNPAFLKTFGVVEGQVHWQGEPVDFMEAVQGEPYVTVRSEKNASELVAKLLRGGMVALDGVGELDQ